MTTTTYPQSDSPENLRSRRRSLEALPQPVKRRVHVLGNAVRVADAIPGDLEFTYINSNAEAPDKIEASTGTVQNDTPAPVAESINKPIVAKSFLDEAYQMLSDVWRSN